MLRSVQPLASLDSAMICSRLRSGHFGLH